VLLACYAASVCVVLTNPTAGDYPSYGWQLNWLLGLPCWLLGCVLADRFESGELPSRPSAGVIWQWRVGALAGGTLCSALRFHSPLTYPWTLNLFALYAFAWLAREISWRLHRGPAWLDRAGAFSYSIYLCHGLADLLLRYVFGARTGGPLDWALRTTGILSLCFVFYLAVERPAHRLARVVHRWVARWRRHEAREAPNATESLSAPAA